MTTITSFQIIDDDWIKNVALDIAKEYELKETEVEECIREILIENIGVDNENLFKHIIEFVKRKSTRKPDLDFFVLENHLQMDLSIKNVLNANDREYEIEYEKRLYCNGVFKRLRKNGLTSVPQITPPCGRVWCKCDKCINHKITKNKRYEIFMGCLPKK